MSLIRVQRGLTIRVIRGVISGDEGSEGSLMSGGMGPGPRATTRWFISGVTVLVLFVAWDLVARFELVSRNFVPTPLSVWQAFIEIGFEKGYGSHHLWFHLGSSLGRLLAGYVLAILTAVPLGMAMGYCPRVRAVFEPLIDFYRPLPPLAYYTILVVWMGIDNESKIALLYLAAFPPLALNALAGVRSVPQERIEAALSLGAGRWQVFRHVIFPSCLPHIFTGMLVSIGFTYTTLVSAEMVGAAHGIGWMVWNARRFARMDVIFMGNIIMGITGLLLAATIRMIGNKVCPWRDKV